MGRGTSMKIKKQLTALLLSLCLAGALAVPTAAAKSAACGCGEVVQVFVRGFLRPLYYNAGLLEGREAFLPLHLFMDAHGDSVLPIGNAWRIDPGQDHTAEPEYEFLYDYRADPFESAGHLNDFIEALCKETKHDKVALTGMSQGTSIVTTYLAQYGTRRLDTLIVINGSWQGVTLFGELMTNRLAFSSEAMINFIASLAPESGFMNWTADLLRKTPAARFKTPPARDLLGEAGDRLSAKAAVRALGQMPAVWTFLPDEYFAEARKLLDGDPAYERLRNIADRYYNKVQTQAPRLLREAKKAGVKVAVICAYGKAPIPLLESTDYQCDMLIDTVYASGGATAAPLGETLPPGNSRYRSPDGILDAATCALPDQTWFIKYNGHQYAPSWDLRQWIIHSKSCPSVTSNPQYPQYLRLVKDDKTEPLKIS